MSDTPARRAGRLAALGVYGFEAQEPVSYYERMTLEGLRDEQN